MKKLILSAAVLFALSVSTGAIAQEKKQDKSKTKTECCTADKSCGDKDKKSSECCPDGKKDKACCDKKTASKDKKKENKK